MRLNSNIIINVLFGLYYLLFFSLVLLGLIKKKKLKDIDGILPLSLIFVAIVLLHMTLL